MPITKRDLLILFKEIDALVIKIAFNTEIKSSQIFKRFRNIRKANMNFDISIRPSAWNNSVPIGRIFMKFDI